VHCAMAAGVRWKIIGDTCINGLMAYVRCEINAYSAQYNMTPTEKTMQFIYYVVLNIETSLAKA